MVSENLTADSVLVKEQLQRQQNQYSLYYNPNAGTTLKPLNLGQPVRILDLHTKIWEPGTVVKKAKEPRSRLGTQTEEVNRRTRAHLRPAHVTHHEPSRIPGSTANAVTTDPSGKAIGEAPMPSTVDQASMKIELTIVVVIYCMHLVSEFSDWIQEN